MFGIFEKKAPVRVAPVVPAGALAIDLDPRYIRESQPEIDFGFITHQGVWVEVCGCRSFIPFNQIFDVFVSEGGGFQMLHFNTPDEPYAIAAVRNMKEVYGAIHSRIDWQWAIQYQNYLSRQVGDDYLYY